jgi:hypothetical protein
MFAYLVDGIAWQPSNAGPLFTAGYSNWNRNSNSTELYGYPALTGPEGAGWPGLPTQGAFVYATYLAPSTDFTQRWLIRRPLQVNSGILL